MGRETNGDSRRNHSGNSRYYITFAGNWKCEFEADVPGEAEVVWIKDKVKLVARGWRYP